MSDEATDSQRRKVFIISSNDVGWSDLRSCLRTMENVRVVGEATTAQTALDLVDTLQPDIVISAARVEGRAASPFLVELRHNVCASCSIIVFASRIDPCEFLGVTDTSISGYFLWNDMQTSELRPWLTMLMSSELVAASRDVVQAFIDAQRGHLHRDEAPRLLSARDRLVLQRMAEGRTLYEIAKSEGLGLRTVERIIERLEIDLAANNRFVLGVKLAQLGLLD